MRRIFVLLLACMFVAGSAGAGMAVVQIDETNFLDAVFRGYVSEHFDTDKDGILSNSEILNAKEVDIGDRGTDVRSLQGIKNLTSLERLHCRADRLTELDLSGMTSLMYVDCTYATDGRLSTIKLNGCSSLSELNCEHSGVTSIDLTGCTSLNYLYANDNKLTSLILKDCTLLEYLSCHSNVLTELDLTTCPEVLEVYCNNNKISDLDLSKNEMLVRLECQNNRITALDLSKNLSLYRLCCDNNRLVLLNVADNTGIYEGDYACSPQYIDGLTVSQRNGKYTVSLSDYLSADVKNVVASSVYGKDSDGKLIHPAYDSGTGAMTFDVQPASIYYDYDTKYSKDDNKRYMGVTIAAGASPVITTSSTLPTGTVYVPYSLTFTANGEKPITWTFEGSLPEGLTFENGTISGTPTAAGVFMMKVTATNDFDSATKTFTLSVSGVPVAAKPAITTESLPDATQYAEYSATITATGDGITWTADGLPDGLELDASTGAITGTPSESGTFTVTVTAENTGGSDSKELTLVVAEHGSVTPSPEAFETKRWQIENGSLVVEYGDESKTFQTIDGTDGHTFKIDGEFPANLTIHLPAYWELDVDDGAKITVSDSSGVIQADDVDGLESPAVKVVGYNDVTLSEDGIIMTAWKVDEPSPVPANLETTKWERENGKLIVETTGNGHYEFDAITSPDTNGDGFKISGEFPEGLVIHLPAEWGIDVDTSYAVTVSDDSRIIPHTEIPGLPETAYRILGRTALTLNASDIEMTAFLFTAPTITTSADLGAFTQNRDISIQLEAEGTVWTMKWSATGLPDSLTLDEDTGRLSGSIAETGKYTFAVTVSNCAGENSRDFTLSVNAPGTVIIPASIMMSDDLGTVKAGERVSIPFKASGTAPLTWTAENLPGWLNISSAGLVYGTAKAAGAHTFTVSVTNAAGTDARNFTLNVEEAIIAPSITAAQDLGTYEHNEEISLQLAATGTEPITWTAAGLPAWLEIDAETGAITGTAPDRTGDYSFTATARNAKGTDSRKFTLKVKQKISAATAPTITTASLSDGEMGVIYSAMFEATGTDPITWSATGLPDGFTLNATSGKLSGVPKTGGTFTLTVTAANSAGKDTKDYELTVAEKIKVSPPKITTVNLPEATEGQPYTFKFEAEGEKLTWSATSKTMTWFTFTNDGTLSGTPDAAGTYNLTVKVRNTAGADYANFTLKVKSSGGDLKVPEVKTT
ncbi:MAG: putative Ig domain-containing protein, partial [Synergistaceae bacterium]|nr:putative Ig domain-containing protein [Synergistaceae bacterium]